MTWDVVYSFYLHEHTLLRTRKQVNNLDKFFDVYFVFFTLSFLSFRRQRSVVRGTARNAIKYTYVYTGPRQWKRAPDIRRARPAIVLRLLRANINSAARFHSDLPTLVPRANAVEFVQRCLTNYRFEISVLCSRQLYRTIYMSILCIYMSTYIDCNEIHGNK